MSSLASDAYGLHTQYFRIQMLLHRLPISSRRKRQRDDDDLQPPVLRGWTRETSRQLVHDNAVMIARLGITYSQTFGVESTATVMLDNIYVAATTLISSIMKSKHSSYDAGDLQWLQLLDELMKSLQVHFPITCRMRRTLAQIIDGNPVFEDVFTDNVRTSPESFNADPTARSTMHAPWGSLEAAVNDFILDPDLFSFTEFGLAEEQPG
jgi:hypothetical protein